MTCRRLLHCADKASFARSNGTKMWNKSASSSRRTLGRLLSEYETELKRSQTFEAKREQHTWKSRHGCEFGVLRCRWKWGCRDLCEQGSQRWVQCRGLGFILHYKSQAMKHFSSGEYLIYDTSSLWLLKEKCMVVPELIRTASWEKDNLWPTWISSWGNLPFLLLQPFLLHCPEPGCWLRLSSLSTSFSKWLTSLSTQ